LKGITPIGDRPKTGKKMTIAAAFVCSDGIIICGDTEHVGSQAKFDRKKVFAFPHNEAMLVVAGAGTTDFINMSIDMLRNAFESGEKTFASIERSIKNTVRVIYRDHIGVQVKAQQLSADDRPMVFLCVAARLPDGAVRAWKVSETAVSTVRHTEFVGVGQDVAMSLANWLYPEPATDTIANVRILAKEIIGETKRISKDVGGSTHICTLPTGKLVGSTWHVRKRFDTEFFWGVNTLLGEVLQMATRRQYGDAAFQAALDNLTRHLTAIRKKAQSLKDGEEWEMMFDPLD
jgi:hypothetical protein